LEDGFAGLQLAAGEFPQTAVGFMGRALSDQVLAGLFNKGGYHSDLGRRCKSLLDHAPAPGRRSATRLSRSANRATIFSNVRRPGPWNISAIA
jgi:hypothetical protein